MWKQNEKLDYSQNIGHKTNTVLILWSDIRARNIQQWLKLEKNKRPKKTKVVKTTFRVTQDTTIVNDINLLKLIFNMKNEST